VLSYYTEMEASSGLHCRELEQKW